MPVKPPAKIKSPLLAALLGGDDGAPTARRVKSPNTAKPKAARVPSEAHTFHGEPMKAPSPAQQNRDNARSAKTNATRNWIEGHISTTKHDQIHRRANNVLKHGKKA